MARKNILPFAASLLVFVGSLGWGASGAIPQLKNFFADGELRTADSTISKNRAESNLRWMLEAYYAKHGRYPYKLTSLVKSGLATDTFLRRIGGYSIRYHLTADGQRYTLL